MHWGGGSPHAARAENWPQWRGAKLEINFQNEWIVAWRDGQPIAMSPDLICVLDSVAGEAVAPPDRDMIAQLMEAFPDG